MQSGIADLPVEDGKPAAIISRLMIAAAMQITIS
jgi:hypothetical protein